MKKRKVIHVLLALTLFLCTFTLPISSITATELASTASANGIVWSPDVQTVYQPASGGVWYPRMLRLDEENWLISFDTNEGGGNTRVVVVRTEDGGISWSAPVNAANEEDGNAANGQMLLLPSGEIWLAYRKVVESGGQIHTSLRVKQSTDDGQTWSDLPLGNIIVEESATQFKGVWEPHLEMINDEVVVLYADDGPNAVGNTNYQNLYMKRWTDAGWSERIVISDGVAARSRDGMPVITKMADGKYMTIFEASDIPGHPFVIKYKISDDGFNWDGPRHHLYTPIGGGKKAGAPFVITLSDGRLVAAFQTDENSSNTGDPYTSMHTMVGDSNGLNWAHKAHTFQLPSTSAANWNSMMVVNSQQIVAATSSNYPVDSIYIRHGYTEMKAATNLVNNGSFENGNILGWRTYGLDFPERIHLLRNDTSTRENTENGDYYLSLSGISEPRSAYIGQSISGLADGTYTFTAQMRGSGGQNACVMEVKDYGGDMRGIPCPTSDDWTTITIENIEVSSGTATIGFFVANSSAEQWVDIDDIQFITPADPTVPNEPGETNEDVTAPAWPSNSSASYSNVSRTSVTLSWPSAMDDVGVTQYKVSWSDRAEEVLVEGDVLTLNVTGLQAATNYSFIIEAADAAGNWSEIGLNVAVKTSSNYNPPAQPNQPQNPVEQEAAPDDAPDDSGTTNDEQASETPESPNEQHPVDFKDVPADHWAASAIKQAANLHIIQGHPNQLFMPNAPTTRAQFMVMLANALKWENEEAHQLNFNDNERIGAWALDAIAQGLQLGVVTGYADGSFRPSQEITRIEMTVMLARALGVSTDSILSASTEHTSFADDASIPSWGKAAVENLRELGIIAGRSNNTFAPNETATRAEALVILMRVINKK